MRRIPTLLCLALLAAACGDAPSGQDRPLVAATPWPLQWLAEQVAPEAEVRGLGQAGQDPHELDLRPAERELLERADVVLFVGPVGFQPQVEEAAAGRGEAAVAITQAAADLLLDAEAHEHAEDEHAEDEHAEDEAVDPHVWFDPRTLAEAADALAEALAAVDPDRADGYRERAAAVRGRLLALHE
ncbi:MAG TPA: metal ABC transporter substrate-binding protein, partial [Egibacteraceae bacterium]|nr:metal ABC transporter substrate-binding protein [Egibacteraceae bacterium]